ncbi:MAG: hypothetical protein ACSHXB_01275 [Sulfitobacter sp.]
MDRRLFNTSLAASAVFLGNASPAAAQNNVSYSINAEMLFPKRNWADVGNFLDEASSFQDSDALVQAVNKVFASVNQNQSNFSEIYERFSQNIAPVLAQQEDPDRIAAGFKRPKARKIANEMFASRSRERIAKLMPQLTAEMTFEEKAVLIPTTVFTMLTIGFDQNEVLALARDSFGRNGNFKVVGDPSGGAPADVQVTAESEDEPSETVIVYPKAKKQTFCQKISSGFLWIASKVVGFVADMFYNVFFFGAAGAGLGATVGAPEGGVGAVPGGILGATAGGGLGVIYTYIRTGSDVLDWMSKKAGGGLNSSGRIADNSRESNSGFWLGPLGKEHEICNSPLVLC